MSRAERKKGHKIFIIDDEKDVREYISKLLADDGYEHITTYQNFSFPDMLKTDAPDLIILDILMPRHDGLDICRGLKLGRQTRDIKILAISATEDESKVRELFKLGINDFIEKPFESETLLNKVRSLLS